MIDYIPHCEEKEILQKLKKKNEQENENQQSSLKLQVFMKILQGK